MAEKEVKIKITAGTKPLRDLQAELKKAKEELAKLDLQGQRNSKAYKEQQSYIAGLSNEYKRLQTAGKDAEQGLNQTSKSITDLSTKIGIAAVAMYGLVSAFSKVIDSAQAGAAFEQLNNAFIHMSGGAAQASKDLEFLRQSASGNLDTTELITYANEMRSLGYSVDTAAKLLDIVDTKSDELGITFEAGQNALQKFITTGSGRGLIELGINIAEVRDAMTEYTGATEEQIAELDDLTQQQIRSTVITKLYGQSVDEINKKQKGNDDIIANLQSTYRDLGTLLNVFVAGAFVEVAKKSDIAGQSLEENLSSVQQWGEKVGDLVNGMIALEGWFNKWQGWLSPVTGVIDVLTSSLTNLYWSIKNLLGLSTTGIATQGQGNPLGVETFGPVASPEQIEAARQKQLQIDIQNQLDKTKPGSTKNGSSLKTKKDVKDTKELFTEIDVIAKKIAEKREMESLYLSKNLESTQAYLDLLTEIVKLETERTRLMGGPQIGDLEAATVPRTPIEEVKFFPSVDTEGALAEERNKAIEDGKTVYNNIANIMNLLGLEANSFVSTLISGFNTVLAIMESIKAVNTILSFIPGLATGGSVTSGMPYIVGERGAELFMPNQNGQIINNRDTMKILSQSANQQNNIVNVYVGGALDGQTFLKKNFPQYERMKNYKRIN